MLPRSSTQLNVAFFIYGLMCFVCVRWEREGERELHREEPHKITVRL